MPSRGATDEYARFHAINAERILVPPDADFADILKFPRKVEPSRRHAGTMPAWQAASLLYNSSEAATKELIGADGAKRSFLLRAAASGFGPLRIS